VRCDAPPAKNLPPILRREMVTGDVFTSEQIPAINPEKLILDSPRVEILTAAGASTVEAAIAKNAPLQQGSALEQSRVYQESHASVRGGDDFDEQEPKRSPKAMGVHKREPLRTASPERQGPRLKKLVSVQYEDIVEAAYQHGKAEERERWEPRLEIVTRERDAYKAYIDRIVQLKADALINEPLPTIIVNGEFE
jgi:hypothetical protein